MLLSNQNNFLFLHVPKAAGTTIKNILREQVADACRPLPPKILELDELGRRPVWGTHLTLDEIHALTDSESILGNRFSFAFTRNPYDRIYSAYGEQLDKHAARFPRDDYIQDIRRLDFCTFFTSYANSSSIRFDVRFCNYIPAHYFACYLGSFSLDFLGKVERFEEDFAEICRITGIGDSAGPVMNARSAPAPGYRYLDKYNSHAIELVNHLYADDFRLGNYRKLDPGTFLEHCGDSVFAC